MVATLVRLQLALTRNAFRKSVWLLVGQVIGMVYAVALALAALFGLVSIRVWGEPSVAGALLPLAFGALSLLYVLATLLFFGVDETLDPARFAILPVRARDLMPGLVITSLFLSGFGLFLVLVGVGFVVASAWSVPATVVAVVGAALGLLGTVLLARAVTAWFARGLSGRRTRDVTAVLLVLLILAFSLGMQTLGSERAMQDPAALLRGLGVAGTIAGWTPFGWAWAAPVDILNGRPLLAVTRLLLAAGLVVGAWAWWARSLDRALTSPLETGGGTEKVAAHGFADRLFPTTPAGAVAARSLRYWRRDPRHLLLLALVVVMPFMWLGPTFLNNQQTPSQVLLLGPALTTVFFGMIGSSELSYDGSALSVHVLTGIRGRDDRLGRLWSMAIVLLPIVLLMQVAAFWFAHGRLDQMLASVAATIAVGGSGAGAGLLIGTLWNIPTAPPGGNVFRKPQGGQVAGLINFGLITLLTFVAAAPAVALALTAAFAGGLGWALGSLAAAVAAAALMLWIGIWQGGRVLDRRWPEILKQVTFEG